MSGRRGRPSGGPAYIREMGINTRDTLGVTVHKPILQSDPRPLESSDELCFMAEVKQELQSRFMASAFYLNPSPSPKPLHRYLDKYQEPRHSSIDWSYLPQELQAPRKRLRKSGMSEPVRKKVKTDDNVLRDLDIDETEGAEAEEKEGEGEPKEKDPEKPADAEEEEVSDEDYLEEGNDYAENYFDNGENYLEDSDDNLDDDAVF